MVKKETEVNEVKTENRLEVRELLEAKTALQKLLNSDLPVRTSFKLSRLVRKINEELTDFETKKIELIKKYGKENDKKGIEVTEENKEKFFNDMTEVLKVKIRFDVEPIALISLEGAKLSAVDMVVLEKFIKEE